MKVQRIVTNIKADSLEQAQSFYHEIFGLNLLMDLGFIQTFGNDQKMPVQLSIATEGGSDAPVPDLTFEVDDISFALTRVRKFSINIEYGPVAEPWGAHRFFIRDPFGKLINVMQHSSN